MAKNDIGLLTLNGYFDHFATKPVIHKVTKSRKHQKLPYKNLSVIVIFTGNLVCQLERKSFAAFSLPLINLPFLELVII
jgi:hypothetical protein